MGATGTTLIHSQSHGIVQGGKALTPSRPTLPQHCQHPFLQSQLIPLQPELQSRFCTLGLCCSCCSTGAGTQICHQPDPEHPKSHPAPSFLPPAPQKDPHTKGVFLYLFFINHLFVCNHFYSHITIVCVWGGFIYILFFS